MITVLEAQRLIARHCRPFPDDKRPLRQCLNSVLREDIRADRDLPPFHKSLVDGIAIALKSYAHGQREFIVQGIQPAGQPPDRLRSQKFCFEIMTGGALPAGCDCIVPVEQVHQEGQKIRFPDDLELQSFQFVRWRGADERKGNLLLSSGAVLGPAQISIAASVGKDRIKVNHQPRIAVVSTGDELVDLGRPVHDYQVRTSNSYAVQAALRQFHFHDSQIFHCRDDQALLRKKLGGILKGFDVLVLSGGVSMGKFDFVPAVLKELGVEVIFHKVRQRPGKPFWFGKNKAGKMVFALPGNPVSTLVCTYRYVIPALLARMGKKFSPEMLPLARTPQPSSDLTLFVPVKKKKGNDEESVEPVEYGGSGDFAALASSDGFVQINPGRRRLERGTRVAFYSW